MKERYGGGSKEKIICWLVGECRGNRLIIIICTHFFGISLLRCVYRKIMNLSIVDIRTSDRNYLVNERKWIRWRKGKKK